MRVKERLLAIKLIEKTKDYPVYTKEIGIKAETKKVILPRNDQNRKNNVYGEKEYE